MADTSDAVKLPFFPSHLTSWIPGKTPMSTWPAASTAILSFLVVVFGLQELMKDRPAFKLRTIFRIHNAFLSIGSLLLLALTMNEVTKLMYNAGPYDALCAKASFTTKLEFYYMINYYFKYYEFLDTVFLVLKKRPLTFLHVFHHSSTALLAFVQQDSKIIPYMVILTINSLFMWFADYYYYATAGGAKLWWKKYLTTMQIAQFVIDIVVFNFGLYQHIAFTYMPFLPHIGDCAGDLRAAIFAGVLLLVFLGLFANFYIQTYKKTDGQANGKGKDRPQVTRKC
ncbi:fatty acid elongase [Lanmaoa asiatica]|nr:fatty acid elongase [Lanmaoa asiatica]